MFFLVSTLRGAVKNCSLSKELFGSLISKINRKMSSIASYEYDTLDVSSIDDFVLHVQLNRPDCRNAMNKDFWRETLDCFRKIKDDRGCRAVIISGAGKMFSAGLDFNDMMDLSSQVLGKDDVARKAKYLHSLIQHYQQSFSAIEECQKPVIAAIHNGCLGAGVNLISACDMRYCTEDAYFQIKEIDIGIAADVGVLQRLPKAIGNDSFMREYVYTCEKIDAACAKEMGIVSRIFPGKNRMIESAVNVARVIASKSPVAVQGSKIAMNYSRDHSVQQGLEFMTYWNMTMMQSEDVIKAAEATITKSKESPKFTKL